MPPVRPYLLSGAASGALIAGAVAGLLSITTLVSEGTLPGDARTLKPTPAGILNVGPAGGSAPTTAGSSGTGIGAAGLPSGPLALGVPTASVTVSAPALPATVSPAPAPRRAAAQGGTNPRQTGHRSGPGSKASGRNVPGPPHQGPGPNSGGGGGTYSHGGGAPGPGGGGSPHPGGSDGPPSAASGPSHIPPGLAKKPGQSPPGLAKKQVAASKAAGDAVAPSGRARKPKGTPPGLAKKGG
jgi:hypothetical protein